MKAKKPKKIVVEGAGIAGIAAALDAAEKGREVLLVEKTPWIGGKLSQLDFQFPNDQCGMCQIQPLVGEDIPRFCLRRILDHPRIEILTNAEVVDVKGKQGNLKLRIRVKPRGVKETCFACGKCTEVCPVEAPDPFNYITGKAIYIKYPNCFPNIYAIDFDHCTKCGECVKVCPVDAIDLNEKEREMEIEAETLIWAAGIRERDLSYLSNYGFGRIKNVVISTHFERLLSELGPNGGELLRPSDGKPARKVAFIQCAGSRDRENPNCSSICCMYALKEARLLKRKYRDAEPVIFFMDLRTFGKGEYRYFLETDARFVPCRPGKIEEDEEGNPLVYYVDENDNRVKETFDLVVLSVGTQVEMPPFDIKDGIKILYSTPLEISDAITAAYSATHDIKPQKKEERELWKPDEEKDQIAYVITKYADGKVDREKLDGVIIETGYLKETEELQQLKERLCSEGIERFVVLAGEPYYIDRNLRKFFDPLQYQIVDVYLSEPLFAIKAAEKRLRYLNPLHGERKPVVNKVVVLGGGITGMRAASILADRGYEVHLIEKSSELGGNALRIKKTHRGEKVEKIINELKKSLKKVKVHLEAELVNVRGHSGNWILEIEERGKKIFLEAGSIIVATGAQRYVPKEYLYGKDQRIITQLDFEEMLSKGKVNADTVVMIQCVGSRNREHPWCSRICCRDAIKNAIWLKELDPEKEVYILYRDIMAYGDAERDYAKAREMGVVFLRFKEGEEPEVKIENGALKVSIRDTVLKSTVEIEPDLLILSTGIVPNPDNRKLAEILNLPLDEDGFFMPANIKFNPIESPHPGIFIAGLAHSPRNIEEALIQAEAAASRAITFLNTASIPARSVVSYVHERRCAGCGFCIDLCPFEARILDEERKVIRVLEAICQGCGLCVAGCPSGATELIGTEDKAILTSMNIL